MVQKDIGLATYSLLFHHPAPETWMLSRFVIGALLWSYAIIIKVTVSKLPYQSLKFSSISVYAWLFVLLECLEGLLMAIYTTL